MPSESDTDDTNGRSRAAKISDRLGQTLADEAVNAVGILAIAYMAAVGVTAYEPIAAVASIALGAKYLGSRTK